MITKRDGILLKQFRQVLILMPSDRFVPTLDGFPIGAYGSNSQSAPGYVALDF